MSFNLNTMFKRSINVIRNIRFLQSNINLVSVLRSKHSYSYSCHLTNTSLVSSNHYFKTKYNKSSLLAFSVFTWLGLEQPSENFEDDLITNIKWSILLMQRQDYKKAERLLHVTLRMAQQLQNQKAITYIYDLMANLALETEQYDKAEKLFVSVMERLLSSGYPENHIKNIHISLKLAKCYEMSGKMEKANTGYSWVLNNLERIDSDDKPTVKQLLAYSKDWYGHYLNETKHYQEAIKHLKESYQLFTQLDLEENIETRIYLLNDMSVIYEKIDDLDNTEKCIKEAIKLTSKFSNDPNQFSVLYVNLGRIFLRKSFPDKAVKCCERALKYALTANSKEYAEEANKCLNEAYRR